MCTPFDEGGGIMKDRYDQIYSEHKMSKWKDFLAEQKQKMIDSGWDPSKDNPKNRHPAWGMMNLAMRMAFEKQYEGKYNTPGQGVHASGTGRKLDDPTATQQQQGAAASGRDQNLGAGGGTNPESNQNTQGDQSNPDGNTNQSNKDQAGSKKSSRKEDLKIPKPDVNLPNQEPPSSGGVNY